MSRRLNRFFNDPSCVLADSLDAIADLGPRGWTVNGDPQVVEDSGKCLEFDGVDDKLSISSLSSGSFGTGDFTIIMWTKVNSLSTNLMRIVGQKGASGSIREWALVYDQADGEVRFFLKNQGGGNQQSINSTDLLNIDKWTFLVATYDGRGGSLATDGMNIYFDAVLSVPKDQINNAYTAMSNTTADLEIGRYAKDLGNAFNGSISEVRIYKKALTPLQISDLYALTRIL